MVNPYFSGCYTPCGCGPGATACTPQLRCPLPPPIAFLPCLLERLCEVAQRHHGLGHLGHALGRAHELVGGAEGDDGGGAVAQQLHGSVGEVGKGRGRGRGRRQGGN